MGAEHALQMSCGRSRFAQTEAATQPSCTSEAMLRDWARYRRFIIVAECF